MSVIQAALGTLPADLLVTDVRLANVFTGEIFPADIAIAEDRIVAVEAPGTLPRQVAHETLRGGGRIAAPGLVDSHLHIESSLLTPAPFAEAVLRHGTTTIAEDPHEIANAVGLAKVMDARAVIDETPRMSAILAEGRRAGDVIEGHNPMPRGRALNAYIAAGIDSDHTLMTPDLLMEKLRLGVCVQLQERYMRDEILALLRSLLVIPDVCLVTDDVSPDYFEKRGHLDQVLRRAIALGLPPMIALGAATIQPARRLRLHDAGAIAPGYRADLMLVDDLERFAVSTTISDGRVVVRDGESVWPVPPEPMLDELRDSLALSPIMPEAFRLAAPVADGAVAPRAIVSHTPGTITESGVVTVDVHDGEPQLSAHEDLCLIAVLARGGSNRFVGLLCGLGLRAGAVATSHAHDSHNPTVIGRDRQSMATAANAVIEAGGGIAVAEGAERQAFLPLPIAGGVSAATLAEVAAGFRAVRAALHELGINHPHLLMRRATYILAVSSGLRITDRGLVDAAARAHVPLAAEMAHA